MVIAVSLFCFDEGYVVTVSGTKNQYIVPKAKIITIYRALYEKSIQKFVIFVIQYIVYNILIERKYPFIYVLDIVRLITYLVKRAKIIYDSHDKFVIFRQGVNDVKSNI